MRERCIEHLQSRKAEDLAVIDLRGIADFSDYFIVCTGAADTQVRALADAVIEGLKSEGHRPWQVEGYDTRKWILIDFVDVVVHIFQSEERQFYSLERLWGDAPIEHIEDEGPTVEMQNQ
ncbi:MAG: ribosome silencing factor [Candidatus Latescibacteria bacterium]|nr:ribosome silencing factor [Candidatus Latescibacterota bacterium]